MKVIYCGPYETVTVINPNTGETVRTLQRGEAGEIPDDLLAGLDPAEFQPAKPANRKKDGDSL